MASIKKRGDSFIITVSKGRDAEGKQLRIYETFVPESSAPTKARKEAEKFATELERKVQNGDYSTSNKMLFSELVKEWDSNWAKTSGDISESTREGYISILNNRIMPYLKNEQVRNIRPANIQKIYNEMKQRGLSQGSIKRTNVVMRSVFKYAEYNLEIIERNPCDKVRIPKTEKKENQELNIAHSITETQAEKFFRFLEDGYTVHHEETMRKISDNCIIPVGEYTMEFDFPLQWRVFFNLAYWGGFRKGELIALTWDDIDLQNELVYVNKSVCSTKEHGQYVKSPKTKAGNRAVWLDSTSWELLREWKQKQIELSFELMKKKLWRGYTGKEYGKNNVFIQLRNVYEKDEAGNNNLVSHYGLRMDLFSPTKKFGKLIQQYNDSVPEDEKLPVIRLHDLRHSSITRDLKDGMDINTVLKKHGHTDFRVAYEHYGEYNETNY